MRDEQETLILVASSQVRELNTLTEALTAGGFSVEAAGTAHEAQQLFEDHKHTLVLIDLSSPDEFLELIPALRKSDALLPILVLADRAQSKLVEQAIEKGASDCLSRPFQLQKLIGRVARWGERRDGLEGPIPLDGGLREEPGFKQIVGSSDKIKSVFDSIKIVTASDVPVLIQGETGTGKELVARAIHYRGSRRKRPFYTVNCAAIPEALLESELFGHERGAFTGAVTCRKGKFEMTDGGTLFLDEIGEMAIQLQSKILRAIEDHTFRRIGGHDLINSDVRIVSATNKDLHEEVQEGNFREDLYYRLSVFPIYLPPLRERQGDILELAEYFLHRTAEESSQPTKKLSPATVNALRTHAWPGNVRELQNVMRRATLLSGAGAIEPEHLGLRAPTGSNTQGTPESDIEEILNRLREGSVVPLERIEEVFIRQAIRVTEGNITEAANRLGVSRSTIYRKLQEYGLAGS